MNIIHISETASTNSDMKRLASEGAKEGTVLIADSQTAGRGRLGRQFFSPRGTGCYMSILLRPSFSAEKVKLITPMAAVAVCEAIEAVTEKKAEIKWVNDIFIDGKKVAGILTEGSFAGGEIDFVVVGVGMNLSEPQGGFPQEIENIAGAIGAEEKRDEIIQEFLWRFFRYYQAIESGSFIPEYRRRLFILGREITVYGADAAYQAKAIDIDGMCGLVIETKDGQTQVLSSGEISIGLGL